MQKNINRPVRSTTSQVIATCAALALWALSVYSVPAVIHELKTGQAYSLAVFFGSGAKISKNDSPIEFWMNMGLHISGLLIMLIAPIFALLEVIVEHRRKSEEHKRD